jgi:hypothetical protein
MQSNTQKNKSIEREKKKDEKGEKKIKQETQ